MTDANGTRTDAPSRYAQIAAMIAEQRCVVLDGGTATAIAERADALDERLWGTRALMVDPQAVLDVHRRFVEAGCDVLSTNTWGLPSALAHDDASLWASTRPIHWMDIARRGIRLASKAVADAGREGEVAVAFSVNGDIDAPEGDETVRLLARAFGSDPPDLILVETLSLLRPSLFSVVERLLETEIPVWLSFRRCRHGLCGVYGEHWGGPEGDAFGRAARRFEEMGASALLVNCIPPDHVDGMLSYLRDFTDMPLGVYPNLGYYTSAGWRFEPGVSGEEYAEMALRWRDEGAQIIGGCCGVSPEHIAAARARLAGTTPGTRRRNEPELDVVEQSPIPLTSPRGSAWVDRRQRPIYPLAFPEIVRRDTVEAAIPGTYMTWKYLFEEGIGAHQRCLDIGSGTGLQAVQLALNGAAHVHALDVDPEAVAHTLDNAFRNGVAERVTASHTDLFPWIPEERYEVVVATLPQTPSDPVDQLSSHRPADYWGRGLVDQVISKLPKALAPEGTALLTMTSLLSRLRTLELLEQVGLEARVVAWELEDLPSSYLEHREQLRHVEELSDAHHVRVGDDEVLIVYLLEICHARDDGDAGGAAPWEPRG